MANTKKKLQKSAQKFRKTEPDFHNAISKAINYMACTIKKLGIPEVVVVMKDGIIVEGYANDKH